MTPLEETLLIWIIAADDILDGMHVTEAKLKAVEKLEGFLSTNFYMNTCPCCAEYHIDENEMEDEEFESLIKDYEDPDEYLCGRCPLKHRFNDDYHDYANMGSYGCVPEYDIACVHRNPNPMIDLLIKLVDLERKTEER